MEKNTNIINQEQANIKKGNWMIDLAGIVFVFAALLQLFLWYHGEKMEGYTPYLIYNALPVVGALAFLGVRREQENVNKRYAEMFAAMETAPTEEAKD